MTKSRGILPSKRFWTEAEIDLLRRRYADERTEDLARLLDRPVVGVYQKAAKLGLVKSAAYLASPAACRLRRGDNVGVEHRFAKGLTPWNKGRQGITGTQAGCRATWFKKGRPASAARNYLPIGSLRVQDGHLERKVTDDPSIVPARRWVAVHRLVWIDAHGPIPDGHVVVFRAGRKTTELELITPDALELVTRQQLMARNTRHQYGEEIKQVISLRAAISRQINKRTKEAA